MPRRRRGSPEESASELERLRTAYEESTRQRQALLDELITLRQQQYDSNFLFSGSNAIYSRSSPYVTASSYSYVMTGYSTLASSSTSQIFRPRVGGGLEQLDPNPPPLNSLPPEEQKKVIKAKKKLRILR